MANKKTKPFITFETKEEFERVFHKEHDDGYALGFHDGKIWCLSYFTDLITSMFDPRDVMEAEQEVKSRRLEHWRKTNEEQDMKGRLELMHKILTMTSSKHEES